MTRRLATVLACALLMLGPWNLQAEARGGPKGYQRAGGRSAAATSLRRSGLRSAQFRSRYVLTPSLRSMFDGVAARRDQVAHGGWNTRKQIRTRIHKATFSDHGKKHVRARTEVEASKLSKRAAQYLPGLKASTLERTALLKGLWVQRPGQAMWSIYRFDKPVGYDGGKKTYWIRAELSSGTVHGHPMSLERVRKYIKNAD